MANKSASKKENDNLPEGDISEAELREKVGNVEEGDENKALDNNPNSEADVDGFDYENLTGDAFQKYIHLTGDHAAIEMKDGKPVIKNRQTVPVRGSLNLNKKYDFVLLPVMPVREERFPGVNESPVDYVGLKAKSLKPEHTTRITLKDALEYNRQIGNAHSIAGHGKYYFLKQSKSEKKK
jgi:hypothetical protein